jgi:YebC/PmpR family DNA-binding regulatory protein
MAGHSKWKNIQVRKGAQDAKKGKVFTKAAKDLILAAKAGGGDPNHNATLRTAIAKAKAVNLPKDKIDQAIKKGTGELAGGDLYEVMYEGYAPGGVAIMVEAATENKNRAAADIRHIISKNGGNMGEPNCVGWMFDRKGVITFDGSKYTEDQIMEAGLEAGADDVVSEGDSIEVHVAVENFAAVQKAFEDAGLTFENAELSLLPQNLVAVDAAAGQKILNLIDKLEDYEDVQNVYVNADFPDDLMG